MQVKINGVDLEFNLYDVEVMEKYDSAIGSIKEASKNLMNNSKLSDYDKIRGNMAAIRTGFDNIFGEGTGDKVCGGSDLTKCMDAYKALIGEAERQKKEFTDSVKQMNLFNQSVDTSNLPVSDQSYKDAQNEMAKIISGAFAK